MSEMNPPKLSAILITPGNVSLLRHLLQALQQQTVKDQIELVIVGSSKATLAVDESQFEGFWGYQVVEHSPFVSSSEARAAGIRAARAPVVSITEDHCFPEPDWAQHLIAAHQGDWAGVGPAVCNLNPQTLTSWVNIILEYGPWMLPLERGAYHHIPGHNSSYKRDVLLTFGDRLGTVMQAESAMQWELQGKGHKFTMEPNARVRHQNFSVFGGSLYLRFNGGRLFAANRARNWGIGKRAVYSLASPAIPIVRFIRSVGQLKRIGQGKLVPRILPNLWMQLMFDGLGETVGYATGGGNCMKVLTEMEFDRPRYLVPEDRLTAEPTAPARRGLAITAS